MSGPSGNTVDAEEVQAEMNDDLRQQAEDAGVDVSFIVDKTIQEDADLGLTNVVRLVESTLKQQVEMESTETVSGILAGSRDRYGKNWPRRYALVRSDGDHIEVASWPGSLPTPDGGEAEIPAAAAVDMRVEYDSEYDSYEAKQLDSVTKLSKTDLSQKLAQVAVHPSEIGRDDEYETVAVRGTVAYVNPQTVFDDGSPAGDGPIMLADDRGRPKPHFELVLSEEADTRIRAHVERQRYCEPLMAIDSFEKLCKKAQDRFNTPDNQTKFVGDVLRERDVVVVGNVNKVDQARSDGDVTKYIDIGVAGIVEVVDADDGTEEVAEETTDDADDEFVPDDDQLGNFDPDEGEVHPDQSDDSDDTADVAQVAEQVQQYAELVGMGKNEITAEVITENTAIEAPDSVIEAAIERIGADADESVDEARGGDEPDDPIESLRNSETGQLECPSDSCFANASGKAGLFGHVMGTHIPGDADPEEWVLEQIEG